MPTKKPEESDMLRYIDLAEPRLADGYVLYLRRSIPKKKGRDGEDDEYEKPTKIDEFSIEQQREFCRAYAAKKGLDIVAEFEEVESAKIPDQREAFKNMLQYFKEHTNLGVLAWAPDRLSRNALEAGMLIQFHLDKQIVDFQFCTYYFHQDSSGLEHLMIEFARAMGYSLRLSKTVARGMYDTYHKYKQWQSRPKFGYEQLLKTMSDGQRKRFNFLVPHRGKDSHMGEFDVVQLAFELRRTGMSFDEIAKRINEEGFVTKQGKKGEMTKGRLTTGSKRKGEESIGILRDPFYYGMMTGKLGEVDIREITEIDDNGNKVSFVPAVSEEDFFACQEVNEERARKKSEKHDNLPFRDLIRCGHCKMAITPQSKKQDKHIYYYCTNSVCTGRRPHAQKKGREVANGITGDELFKKIGLIFQKKFQPSQRDMTAYLLYLEKRNRWNRERRERNIKSYTAQIANAEKRIEELDAEVVSTVSKIRNPATIERITKTHEKRVTELNKQIKAKSDRITKLRGNERPITLDVEEWLELMKKLYHLWKIAKLEPKKVIAQKVFLELIIKDGKVADYTCKDTYKALEKANLDDDGGRWGT